MPRKIVTFTNPKDPTTKGRILPFRSDFSVPGTSIHLVLVCII